MRKLPLNFLLLLVQLASLALAVTSPQTSSAPELNSNSSQQQQLLLKQLLQQASRVMASPRPAATRTSTSSPGPQKRAVPAALKLNNQTRSERPLNASSRVVSGGSVAGNLLQVRQKWRSLERALGDSLENLGSGFRATLGELLANSSLNVSAGCQSSLLSLTEAISGRQLWASRLVDASARLPAGLLQGTLTELGNFDQCLAIVAHQEDKSGGQQLIRGQYCTIQIKPALLPRPRLHTVCQKLPAALLSALQLTGSGEAVTPQTRLLAQHVQHFHYAGLRLGLCLPSKCSRADLQQLLAGYLGKYELTGQVRACQTGAEPTAGRFDTLQQCIILTFGLLLLLVCLGTLLDYQLEGCYNESAPPKLADWNQQQHLKLQENPLRADFRPALQFAPGEAARPGSGFYAEEAWIGQLERNAALALMEQRRLAARDRAKWQRREFLLALGALFACFSLRRSLREIGRHARKRQGTSGGEMDDIRVIHGLRTLSMVWVIFGHSIGLVTPEMMNNLFPLAELSCSSRALQALLNATLAVNSFFMMSGLVTVVSFARKCRSATARLLETSGPCRESSTEKGRKRKPAGRQQVPASKREPDLWSMESSSMVSSSASSGCSHKCLKAEKDTTGSGWPPPDFQPLLWLAMRYLRLTPAYAAVIGLTILMPALGSGPFWQESVGPMGANCRARWWHNLLYVNNFLETDKLCLIHSWYLSNDWQFFLLALVLFGVFYKWRRVALLLVVSLIVASSAATFAITVAHEFPPTIVTTSPAFAERWTFIHSLYYKPWPHLASYLVGLLVGYLILINQRNQQNHAPSSSSSPSREQKKPEETKTSNCMRRLAWLLFGLIAFSVLNSVYPWNMGLQVDPLLTGLHSATFRTLWAISLGWLVFALSSSPQNPLARLLSWHGFQMTSRLTYCAYLVHPLVIYYHFGSLRERLDSSPYGQFHRFMATLALSYLFAFLLALLIESPAIQLQHFLAKLTTTGSVNAQAESQPASGSRKSESLTTNSWTVAGSSFDINQLTGGEQISGTDFKLLSTTLCSAAAMQNCNHLHAANLLECRHKPEQQTGSAEQQAGSQLDADFQRKLAQAIGRGFRIRSKLAAGTIKHTSGNHKLASAASKHRANQIKSLPRRSPAAAPGQQEAANHNSTKPPAVFISVDGPPAKQVSQPDHRAQFDGLEALKQPGRRLSLVSASASASSQPQELRTFCGAAGSGHIPGRTPAPPPPLPETFAGKLTRPAQRTRIQQQDQEPAEVRNREQSSMGDLNNLNELILSRQKLLFRSQSQTNFKHNH